MINKGTDYLYVSRPIYSDLSPYNCTPRENSKPSGAQVIYQYSLSDQELLTSFLSPTEGRGRLGLSL